MNLHLENEQLHCHICKNLLIHFPISVLSHSGEIICGKCELRDVLPLTRVPWLENILRKSTFTCKFNENGCEAKCSFDFIKEHEGKCIYQSGNCLNKKCTWNGLMIDLHKHFVDIHPTAGLGIPDSDDGTLLTIDLKESISHVRLRLIEDIPFVVEYNYDTDSTILSYQISYISINIQQATFKIAAHNKTLIESICESYKSTSKNLKNLTVAKGCPIAVKVAYTKYKHCTLDYTILNLVVCAKCGGYLIPFAYEWHQKGLICGLCAENNDLTVVSKQPSIKFLIKSTNFPCKWKYCDFVSDAMNMFNHQKTCRFQVYACAICKASQGDLGYMKNHLTSSHYCSYIKDEHPFPVSTKCKNYIFTVNHGTIIILDVYQSGTETQLDSFGIKIEVITLGSTNKFVGTVRFEHDHCRIKSKCFSVTTSCFIGMKELPSCFLANKAFSGTIKIS